MAIIDTTVAHWKLDEAAGNNRADSHGGFTMAESGGTIANTTGKLGSAANCVASDGRSLTTPDHASLRPGDVDFWIALWVQIKSTSAIHDFYNVYGASGNFGAAVLYNNTPNRYQAFVSFNGVATAFVQADNFGAPAINTWHFLFFYHDSVNNLIGLQVNNGTANTTAHSTGVFASTAGARIGSYASGSRFANALIDSVTFGKGGIPTLSDRTALYNGGNGLDYPFPNGAAANFYSRLIGEPAYV